MQILNSKLLRVAKLTSDVFQYDFDFGGTPVAFKPGQFFMIKVKDGKEPPVNRSYSISSPPSEEGFSLCIKLIEGGRASEYLREMQPGTEVEFMAAFGHFFLQDDDEKEIIMVATGTGLAPFMSMLPVLFERGFKKPITLYFGVRYEEDLFYQDELARWEEEYDNFTVVNTLSRPGEGWDGATGRVTEHLDMAFIDPEDTKVYICGNGQMVQDTKKLMEEKGLTKQDIHLEQFTAV